MNKVEKIAAALIFGWLTIMALHAVVWLVLTLSVEAVIYIGGIVLFAVVGYFGLFKEESP